MSRRTDWIVVGGSPGESSYCTRCGEGLRLYLPVRIEIFVAAAKAFVKIHSKCSPGNYVEPPVTTPEEWVAGRDTGISSLTIYSAITGMPGPHRRYDIPHDPADFGRCYRLLNLFPAWKEQLPKVVGLCPRWKSFVENWDELTKLYEEELPSGKAPRLYGRMQALRNPGSAPKV